MKVTGSGPGSPGSIDKARDTNGTAGAGAVGASKEKRRGSPATEIDSGISDKVAISGRAKDSAKAKELASAAPDVDEARIAKLKAAIQGGSYSVNADAVADRLVDEHLFNAF